MDQFILTAEQIRAGRAMVRIDQAGLAEAAGVSLDTVKRLERLHGPVDANVRTIAGLHRAFQSFGVVFDLAQGAGPGVRFSLPIAAD